MYTSKRPPRAHQKKCLDKMDGRRAFAVLAGLRTGKTKCIVDDFGRLHSAGLVDDLIVIAPGGAYRPWEEAILADLPDASVKDLLIYVWDSSKERTKVRERLRDQFLRHRGPRITVVNVEAIGLVKGCREFLSEFVIQRRTKTMTAVDESVVIKEPKSICGKFAVDVLAPHSAYRRILTGLVSPRSPEDLYNQFKFLDQSILGHWTAASFRARYVKTKQVCMMPNKVIYARLRDRMQLASPLTDAQLRLRVAAVDPTLDPNKMTRGEMREFLAAMVDGLPRDRAIEAIQRMGGYIQTIPVVEGYTNVEEINAKIEPHSFRVRLEDCYDMPASDYSFWDVDMPTEQRRIYDEVKKDAIARIDKESYVSVQHVVVQMLRLHQILCGHVVDEEGNMHEVPESRTAELMKIMDCFDGKAIVWCSYDHSIRKVAAALGKKYGEETVSRFWGGNVRTREEEEKRFKSDPLCRFQVATPDAGGRGRDWSAADLVVYYSCRNNLDHRQQSEDRAKAVGKTRSIAYVDMRVPKTVEDRILAALRAKIDMSTMINGDNWKEWIV